MARISQVCYFILGKRILRKDQLYLLWLHLSNKIPKLIQHFSIVLLSYWNTNLLLCTNIYNGMLRDTSNLPKFVIFDQDWHYIEIKKWHKWWFHNNRTEQHRKENSREMYMYILNLSNVLKVYTVSTFHQPEGRPNRSLSVLGIYEV